MAMKGRAGALFRASGTLSATCAGIIRSLRAVPPGAGLHMLRRRALRGMEYVTLVVMSPKSLLRHPLAVFRLMNGERFASAGRGEVMKLDLKP